MPLASRVDFHRFGRPATSPAMTSHHQPDHQDAQEPVQAEPVLWSGRQRIELSVRLPSVVILHLDASAPRTE